jgi:inorganic pyrophosphatase
MSQYDVIDAIIEVPKNSKVKYEFCEESQKIRVDRILPSAYNYPFNYGYIENTIAEDNDTLDIVVLNDQPLFPMSIIKVKPIGVLLMRDGKSIDTLENDPKILAYPIESVDKRYKNYNSINDLQELDKLILKDFFSNYKNNENKVSIVDGFDSKEKALEIIYQAYQRFNISTSS